MRRARRAALGGEDGGKEEEEEREEEDRRKEGRKEGKGKWPWRVCVWHRNASSQRKNTQGTARDDTACARCLGKLTQRTQNKKGGEAQQW